MPPRSLLSSLTQSQIAEMHGVSARTIRCWHARGFPRNADGTYCARLTIRWRIGFELERPSVMRALGIAG